MADDQATTPSDCGHVCCNERTDPHHDHFLRPSVCAPCANSRDLHRSYVAARPEDYPELRCRCGGRWPCAASQTSIGVDAVPEERATSPSAQMPAVDNGDCDQPA